MKKLKLTISKTTFPLVLQKSWRPLERKTFQEQREKSYR